MGRGQQPGSPLPQVDFYALRAEAYIQLCDFSSAIQNLRRAYAFQPENTTFLKRLTLVLYLQVPGAAPGHTRRPPHAQARFISLPLWGFPPPGTSSDSLETSLSLCLCPHLLPLL